jgi:hypothetical protein
VLGHENDARSKSGVRRSKVDRSLSSEIRSRMRGVQGAHSEERVVDGAEAVGSNDDDLG